MEYMEIDGAYRVETIKFLIDEISNVSSISVNFISRKDIGTPKSNENSIFFIKLVF